MSVFPFLTVKGADHRSTSVTNTPRACSGLPLPLYCWHSDASGNHMHAKGKVWSVFPVCWHAIYLLQLSGSEVKTNKMWLILKRDFMSITSHFWTYIHKIRWSHGRQHLFVNCLLTPSILSPLSSVVIQIIPFLLLQRVLKKRHVGLCSHT